MKLSSLLNPHSILLHDHIDSIDTARGLLVEATSKNFDLKKDDVLQALAQRGFDPELVLENGLAIPHGRLPGIDDTIISIMVLQKPLIMFEKEVRLIFLLLTAKGSTTIYFNTLASLFGISQDAALVEKLVNVQNSREFIQLIDSENIEVKKELTVADIMNKNIVSVTPDTNLRKVIDLCATHNLSYVPVIDKDNNFIGELNINDIMNIGIPSYAELVGNLSFLSKLEPFEMLLENEDMIYICDIMKPPSLKILPQTSIIELALQLSQKHRRHAPVVQDKNLLGIVSLMDILCKVLRG